MDHTRPAKGRLLRRHALTLAVLCCTVLFLAQSALAADGITVITRVTADGLTAKDEIWLAGLTVDPAASAPAPADALTFAWRKDTTGWFPTWQLELSSGTGLMPTGLTPRVQGDVATITITRVQPAQGHEYEATLSYSPALGALALQVYDVTADAVVYSGGYTLPPSDAPLYAVAGTALPYYIPVGTTWQVGLIESGRTFLALQHFAQRNTPAALRLQVPSAVPGEYRLYHVAGDQETLLAAFTPDLGEQRMSLDISGFPLGSSSLRLDYVQDGQVLISQTRPLVIGKLDFLLHPLRPDREAGVVESEFIIRSEEPYAEPITLDVNVALYELVWDAQAKTFREVLYAQDVALEDVVLDMSTGSAELPVSIPFPEHRANWKAVFTVDVTPGVATTLAGNDRLFSSHLPAQIEPGESYTIVVFPDTQNMSQSFPTVLTRMTDWVSANAAELNLAAVLHVGDITNHDTAPQWTNAYRSMSLLHGVVPYVLTLGNHDMTNGGGGAVKERGLSRVNDYFKVEEAQRYSNLAGTMTPGRLENHYHLFEFGGDKYVVVALEFGPPNEAVAWAGQIAQQYPDHRFILLTHSYTSNAGGLSRSPFNYEIASNLNTTVNAAPEMWEKLVRRQPNSFMVVSGHTWPQAVVVPYRTARANAGQMVYELLFDWQAEPNGGNGWLGLITFHPDDTMEVRVFSPYLEEWANFRDGNGFTSHVIFDLKTGTSRRIYNN